MYYGGGNVTKVNNQSQPLTSDFVSLTLKGRVDGFTLKGGDSTQGTQQTMYDGVRPFEPEPGAAAGDGGSTIRARDGATLSFEKCTAGNAKQTWAFLKDGKSIGSGGKCLDINSYRTNQGASVWAWSCGQNSRANEFWAINASGTSTTIASRAVAVCCCCVVVVAVVVADATPAQAEQP